MWYSLYHSAAGAGNLTFTLVLVTETAAEQNQHHDFKTEASKINVPLLFLGCT